MKAEKQHRKFPFMPRILISGGGTGGHIFPALAIAAELRRRHDADCLFIGAEDRMEMNIVPKEDWVIYGLPVAGFDRKNLWRNFSGFFKLIKSLWMARRLIRAFEPEVVIGVGGYASGPTLKMAQWMGYKTLIQEQNSFAGVTNKLLAKKADRIFVAYDGMEKFFPADKIVKSGNPVRPALLENTMTQAQARESFGLDPERPTLLIVGGSLGALTINESIEAGVGRLADAGIQVIWQTGKNFGDRGPAAVKRRKGIVVTPFINDMAAAYKAADLVIGRAGAGSISELQILGKPAILVPSPNVAEDHQTHNARALADRGAAVLVPDADARRTLVDEAIRLMADPARRAAMSSEMLAMALPDSVSTIVDYVDEIIFNNNYDILKYSKYANISK